MDWGQDCHLVTSSIWGSSPCFAPFFSFDKSLRIHAIVPGKSKNTLQGSDTKGVLCKTGPL